MIELTRASLALETPVQLERLADPRLLTCARSRPVFVGLKTSVRFDGPGDTPPII